MESKFLDKLIDWKDFELFVRELYETDNNLIVEHNVTEIGKSGAKRQIDVKITQRTKLHTYVTLVECKRWKDKVDRACVDILAASIEDLNASKGVIFTTEGYEKGAIGYAKAKNIDIFVVRDLTPEEWGLPGKVIHFYMHLYSGRMNQFNMSNCKMIPLMERYPSKINLNILIQKEQQFEEGLYLYSIKNGEKGLHLISLLLDFRIKTMRMISNSITVLENGKDGATLVVLSDVEIDFSGYPFRQLKYPFGIVELDKLEFKFLTHVSQTTFHFDRGERYDFALVVENYISKQRNVVSKTIDDSNIELSEQLKEKLLDEKISRGDILTNNSILKVFTEAWVDVKLTVEEKVVTTQKIKFKL